VKVKTSELSGNSREEFEYWVEESCALPWGYLKKQRTLSGGYSIQVYSYMWSAWKACTESISAKLGDEVDIPDELMESQQ